MARVGLLDDRDLLIAGTALYAGDGTKSDRVVGFANTDPRMISLFPVWLRRFFDIDEGGLRLRLYLHQDLDLDTAYEFWSGVTDVPVAQFGRPYRAVADATRRRRKHPMGCPSIRYAHARMAREVLGLLEGLLSSEDFPG